MDGVEIMAEKGFFHPELGYWQEVAEVEDEQPSRPNGTIEVPLKPGENYEWRDGDWQEVAVEEPAPELSPRQFEWLLAISELDTVWDAVQHQAKASGNLALYANLKAQRSASAFILATTLSFKNEPLVQQIAGQAAPDADLSDDRIRDLWNQASQQQFDTLT
jgi:hypothetical protein